MFLFYGRRPGTTQRSRADKSCFHFRVFPAMIPPMTQTVPTSPPARGLPGARAALALLLTINLFNYIDRQVLAAVVPKIEVEFQCSKSQIGWLMSAFLISYTFIAPLFGWLGDRISRWRLIAAGVIVWSLASGGTGLATGFVMMLLTRAVIGVGEAAYGPAAPSLISDLFPVERRGRVLAWFYMAIPVGSALGYVLGGAMADTLGWRWAFYVVVPPGVLLGALCLLMREPRRGAADAVTSHTPRPRDVGVLAHIPSYILNTLGMTAMTFALGGVGAWMPTYLNEREGTYTFSAEAFDRMFGPRPPLGIAVPAHIVDRLRTLAGETYHSTEPLRAALARILSAEDADTYRARIADDARTPDSPRLGSINTVFGGILVVGGILATLAGGWAGDKLRGRVRGSYFLVSAAGMFAGLPVFVLAIVTPLPLGWVFVALAVFCLFFNTGPTNTALANVSPTALRASAFALNILIIHSFGDVVSPPIVGWIDDRASLRSGLLFLAVPIALSGLFWLWGVRYLDRDTALAPTRVVGGNPTSPH
jgi:MFS family permease